MKLLRTLPILAAVFTATVAGAQTPAVLQAEIQSLYNQIVGLNSGVVALRASNAALQSTVASLQKAATATTTTDASQSTAVSQLKAQMATVLTSQIWALNPFVSVNLGYDYNTGMQGPHVYLTGVNLHIVDGMGQTVLANGTGNLIVGYNEMNGVPMTPGSRVGSHNLVIGRGNSFRSYGGLVAGENNDLIGSAASIVGGTNNTIAANTNLDTILGGASNTITGDWDTIAGGFNNTAGGGAIYGEHAGGNVILGGDSNSAFGQTDVVGGGYQNTLPEDTYRGSLFGVGAGIISVP